MAPGLANAGPWAVQNLQIKSGIYNIELIFPGPVKVRATKTKQGLRNHNIKPMRGGQRGGGGN